MVDICSDLPAKADSEDGEPELRRRDYGLKLS